MKATARTVAKSVTTEAPASAKPPSAHALQLEFKRRLAAKSETEQAPSSIKEALVRWLEQEL